MRLLQPDLGEVIDRLTILERKILEAPRQGKTAHHFQLEAEAIYKYAEKFPISSAYLRDTLKLAAVNAVLWGLEDSLRVLRAQERATLGCAPTLEEVAYGIQELNDQRSALIGRLSNATGVWEEKLWRHA